MTGERMVLLSPDDAKSLVMAEEREDRSDSMADHAGSVMTRRVALGWTFSNRESFRVMRKHAALFPATAHLAAGPETFEHRENWSMGNGLYLKDSHYHATGWLVRMIPINFVHTEEQLEDAIEYCWFGLPKPTSVSLPMVLRHFALNRW